MSNFDRMFDIVSGHEGGLNTSPADPGNWTGGAVGAGSCHGTKYGISAAAYPNLDIAGLTLDDAKAIYLRDYWERIAGEQLPPTLALLVFDAAVNNGVVRAARWLQEVAQVRQDGVVGPQTLDAVVEIGKTEAGLTDLCSEFLALRLAFMVALPNWRTCGSGWARRLSRLPFEALGILNGNPAAEE